MCGVKSLGKGASLSDAEIYSQGEDQPVGARRGVHETAARRISGEKERDRVISRSRVVVR